jgi:hypothetical protein
MNTDITFQQFIALPENIQSQLGEYIEYLFLKYSDNQIIGNENEQQNSDNPELTPELKIFLEKRLADYRKNPEKVMSIEEMEDRLLKKFGKNELTT